MRRLLRVLVYFSLIMGLAFFLWGNQHRTPKESPLGTFGEVGGFTFTDQHGEPYGAAELKNKVWVANFFFARCQGPCPLLTANMAALQKKLYDIADARFVSISITPQVDTPEVLARYAEDHQADGSRWRFLTGEKDKIFRLARTDFKLSADDNPDLHTTTFVLVDKGMVIRGYFDGKDHAALAKLADAVRELAK
jgi:protein SCO1/2